MPRIAQGILEIVLPKDNEKDLPDIPDYIRKDMKLHFVESMDEVLKLALEREIQPLPLTPAAQPVEIAPRPAEENLTHCPERLPGRNHLPVSGRWKEPSNAG